MTDNTQPEAGSTHIIRYALEMGLLWIDGDGRDKVREALDALDTLEAQLEAIGAGGVSGPLMGIAAPPTAQAEGWTKTEPLIARSRGEWHEDDGPVVWWSWNGHGWAGESPWCGTPLDSDWPGYHTHWTPAPPAPTSAEGVEHG